MKDLACKSCGLGLNRQKVNEWSEYVKSEETLEYLLDFDVRHGHSGGLEDLTLRTSYRPRVGLSVRRGGMGNL